MANYKCPALGECDKAMSGEIFERSPGEELKCPGCGTSLDLQSSPKSAPKNKIVPMLAGGAAVVAIAAVGGYFALKSAPDVSHTAEAPAASASNVASAPIATPSIEATPVSVTATPSAGIAPSDAETKELRQQSDVNLAKGDAAQAETASSKAAANEMLKLAIAKMSQGKLDDAEKELIAARERAPKGSLVYYNMGVLRLKQGRVDDALKEFEASFMAGFSYFDKMDQDKDLQELRKNPRFDDLVAKYRTAGK